MNITPHTASLPVATVVNPATEGLRRENHQREIITQVTATNPSAAEKGLASDKDRARTPAQANETFDFANLKKQAEEIVTSISDQKEQQGGGQHSAEQEKPQAQSGKADVEHEHNDHTDQQALVDEKIIDELQLRDKEVKAHELAHAATGGSLAGSPSYTFKVGPDGKQYAVGGEVSIDLSTVSGDPQATITKMKKVHAAALAPANPSSQDIKVAANASQKILEAQSDLLVLNSEESKRSSSVNSNQDLNEQSTLDIADEYNSNNSNDFDAFINNTITSQNDVTSASTSSQVTPNIPANTQSSEVLQRANRIENFYFAISQGYEKPDNFQFELTA